MTRGLQRALLMLAVFLVGLVGVALFFGRSHQDADLDPGNQDPAHLAAANALINHLTVPVGATLDPYSSACHAETRYCITSTRLSPKDLLAQVTVLVKAAGASQLSDKCYAAGGPVTCYARFDLNGTHFGAEAGRAGRNFDASPTHLAVVVADASPQAARLSAPLGDWANANPFPAGWVTTTTCTTAPADGCHSYTSDRTNRPIVRGTLPLLYEQARETLSTAGFVLDTHCLPATEQRPPGCLLSGFRNRTIGGFDGELVVLSLRVVDRAHVQLIAVVSTV